MMKDWTKKVLAKWIEENKDRLIQEWELREPISSREDKKAKVAWSTVKKYIEIQPVRERRYYTMREIVDELNDCAGQDCWSCNWHYEIDEQGHIYQDELLGYKIIGWRF